MIGRIASAADVSFELSADILIIGAGAAGMVAALAARAQGADPILIERDGQPAGSTALSAGLIPAAGTRFQAAAGIEDTPAAFAADILAKCSGKADVAVVATLTREIGTVLAWLADRHGLPFEVIQDFRYPGHGAFRMHALPRRTGADLVDRLRSAVEAENIALITHARATTLFVERDGTVAGCAILRPDGSEDRIGCRQLILACNGYGGNKELVERHIPSLVDALWFGHTGNDGSAVLWGEQLGAALDDMAGHQGHGSVAHPHGILITWATVTEGGFQVNAEGRRFANEALGYSEHAACVCRQPGGIAWVIFDARIAAIARQFEDFQTAERTGAILTAATLEELALRAGLPVDVVLAEARDVEACKTGAAQDRFGRVFRGVPSLAAPFCAVKVTGALFHTQGGLRIDTGAQVMRSDGSRLPNVFAAGGAAVGVSGDSAAGYLSGNGLLTAVGLGWIAGRSAAKALMR
jgi:fumarate reductase flavoprotein subunit